MPNKFVTTRAVHIRAAADTNTFEGLACKFNEVDSYGTTFKAGCFTAGGLDTKIYALLWMHDPSRPIGTFTAEERTDGLYIVGQWDNSVAGQEARQAAIGGSASDLSVGFRLYEDPNAAANDITIAELLEVSQVTSRFGAVPGSALTAIRAAFSDATDVEETVEDSVEETPEFDEVENFEADEVEETVDEDAVDETPVSVVEEKLDTDVDADQASLRARGLAAYSRIF